MGLLSGMAEAKVERTPIAIVRQSLPAKEPRMATRIGLAQQNGGSEVDAQIIRYRAAITSCEKRQEWQLALVGLL